ncbi:hypothetical protein Scep_011869 [Stephania cephalantha]|uniref:PORR domain-containing protein n=1 Tax=Stephania cephalantha TaxID=152367 RepID=A0AAP0P9C9_9MAGN
MSASRSLPLRPVFKPNTHVVKLVCGFPVHNFSAYVENWRKNECESESSKIDAELGIRFGFKHVPPEMRLSKDFRRMVKEWQRLPYVESYDSFDGRSDGKKLSMCRIKVLEKRAARTVEKMVEVEWISHFRKWHMIFLGEAYERGRLIEPNPVYAARRKIIHLVILGHRGMFLKEDVRTVREPQEAGFRAGVIAGHQRDFLVQGEAVPRQYGVVFALSGRKKRVRRECKKEGRKEREECKKEREEGGALEPDSDTKLMED